MRADSIRVLTGWRSSRSSCSRVSSRRSSSRRRSSSPSRSSRTRSRMASSRVSPPSRYPSLIRVTDVVILCRSCAQRQQSMSMSPPFSLTLVLLSSRCYLFRTCPHSARLSSLCVPHIPPPSDRATSLYSYSTRDEGRVYFPIPGARVILLCSKPLSPVLQSVESLSEVRPWVGMRADCAVCATMGSVAVDY